MKTVLIAVISLDGRLTRPGEAGPGFASAEDQAWFRHALGEFDCAVMGRATYDTIREEIRDRPGRGLLRVVMTRTPGRHTAGARPGALEFTGAPPDAITADLAHRGYGRCAVLGGGQVYREFLAAGCIDAMWLSLEPVVLAGGTPLADGGPMPEARFRLGEMRLLGPDTLLLNYQKPGQPLLAMPFN